MREVLPRELERRDDPVPAGDAVATQRLDVVAVRRAARRIVQRLVHDFDLVDIGVTRGHGRDTIPRFPRAARRSGSDLDPRRLLVAPDERVPLEREAVGLGQRIGRVGLRPVHDVARAFDRAPLAAVLRRHLVPVVSEVQRRGAGAPRGAEVLGLAGGDWRIGARVRRRIRRRRRRAGARGRSADVQIVHGVADAGAAERELVHAHAVFARSEWKVCVSAPSGTTQAAGPWLPVIFTHLKTLLPVRAAVEHGGGGIREAVPASFCSAHCAPTSGVFSPKPVAEIPAVVVGAIRAHAVARVELPVASGRKRHLSTCRCAARSAE